MKDREAAPALRTMTQKPKLQQLWHWIRYGDSMPFFMCGGPEVRYPRWQLCDLISIFRKP